MEFHSADIRYCMTPSGIFYYVSVFLIIVRSCGRKGTAELGYCDQWNLFCSRYFSVYMLFHAAMFAVFYPWARHTISYLLLVWSQIHNCPVLLPCFMQRRTCFPDVLIWSRRLLSATCVFPEKIHVSNSVCDVPE